MAEMTENEKTTQTFESMPNFRGLWSLSENGGRIDLENGVAVPLGTNSSEDRRPIKIYRSSRPDLLTTDEVGRFRELDVRCIIDFRSAAEYNVSIGNKRLDHLYPVYKVKLPFRRHYRPDEQVKYVPVKSIAVHSHEHLIGRENADQPIGKHFLLNFFTVSYVWAVFNRATWYIKIYSLLHLLVDFVLRTGNKYFIRLFTRNVINKEGLLGTYHTMIGYSQGPICAALKLLSEPTNLPAMINCAIGKDRTGVVSALVLGCLGKSKEYIATDYARSEDLLEPYRARMHVDIIERMKLCPSFTTAKYETMMKTLEYIDEKYGGISEYLVRIGFTLSDQLKLRVNLTS